MSGRAGPLFPLHTIARLLRRRYAHTHRSAHWRLTIHRSHLSSLFPLSFLFRRTADGAIQRWNPPHKEKVCMSCSCAIRLGFDQHFLLSSLRQDFFKEGGGGWVDHASSLRSPPTTKGGCEEGFFPPYSVFRCGGLLELGNLTGKIGRQDVKPEILGDFSLPTPSPDNFSCRLHTFAKLASEPNIHGIITAAASPLYKKCVPFLTLEQNMCMMSVCGRKTPVLPFGRKS